jgi:hypothetical protein
LFLARLVIRSGRLRTQRCHLPKLAPRASPADGLFFSFLASESAALSLSRNEIYARRLGLRRFDFLSCFDAVLI